MKILYAASEAVPFCKTGGLADVAGSLPAALAAQGADVAVVLPLYQKVKEKFSDQLHFECYDYVDLAWRHSYCGLFSMERDGVTWYFLDNEQYFRRPELYGYMDDGERFGFFSRAVVRMLPHLRFWPEVIHCNDWQTALVPIYLKDDSVREERFRSIRTVLSIHNIEYQGRYGRQTLGDLFGLDHGWADDGTILMDGDVNLLKGAILCADAVNAVSPTYANELKMPYFAHRLDGIMRRCGYKLSGVLNGIDVKRYDPAADPHIAVNYSAADMAGKQADKAELQKLMGLRQEPYVPIVGIVSRLVSHKGLDLVKEGAPLGTLDMGGGLAVDYDGSKTNFHSSCNYSIAEFARDVVEVVGDMCSKYGVPHPTLVTESGRAVVAYYSVLVFNVLDVTSAPGEEPPPELPDDAPELLKAFADTDRTLARKNMQECYNDACYYRDQLRAQFFYGNATLRQRGLGEAYYWHILSRISRMLAEMETIPEDLRELSCSMVDFYYGNFSLFQSLPDSWAIRQLFPVMPLHRLNERPTNKAVLADITCDCDGKIDHFIDREDVATALPLHAIKPGEDDYYIGVFLVGAYQETLGDLHNLLGDTNVVGVHLEGGRPVYTHEVEGDTVSDVLSYVEYDPKELINKFRTFAEQAVAEGKISPSERRRALEVFRSGLNGYTYYEL